MPQLFLKIFLFGVICFLLLWGFKKCFSFFFPYFGKRSRVKALQHLIYDRIYTEDVIVSAADRFIPRKCQRISPYSSSFKKKSMNKGELTQVLDRFIDQNVRCRYFLLLADSGMGKTTFLLNYYLYNNRRSKKKKQKIVLISLKIDDADQLIGSMPDQNNTILMLDGLDEDCRAFSNPHERVRQLIDLTRKYKRVVITSDLDFIPRLKHLPVKKEYEIIQPKNVNDATLYRLKRFYMSPLAHGDVKKYLNMLFMFRKQGNKKKILNQVQNNPFLDKNLKLLTLISAVCSDPVRIISLNDGYQAVIKSLMSGMSDLEKSGYNQILGNLAKDQYMNWLEQKNEAIDPEEITRQTQAMGIDSGQFKETIRLLISETGGRGFEFSHWSIMEHLFVQQLIRTDKSCYQVSLTNLMKRFLFEKIESGRKKSLTTEFKWLSAFELRARGLNVQKERQHSGESKTLLELLLLKNNQYLFLKTMDRIFQNPIFYEFGWNPRLAENIKHAIFDLESSLMKFTNKDWVVSINPRKIEIKKAYEKNVQIFINKEDYQQYERLKDEISLIKLYASIGLKGLKMLRNINKSKKIVVLPDLKTASKFTICFDETLFDKAPVISTRHNHG